MKNILWWICIIGVAGCVPVQQTLESEAPQLLYQSPLPGPPPSLQKLPSEIYLALSILENGTIDQVRFMQGSGSREWDSLAAPVIKQWRFSPAQMDGKPVKTWFHFRAPLHYAQPVVLDLAQIVCATKAQADSAYEALEQGRTFGDVVKRYSMDSSRSSEGVIGEKNVYSYPEDIRSVLLQLDTTAYTAPFHYGSHYVIFKRMRKIE